MRNRLLPLLVLALFAPHAAGCASDCSKLRGEYDAAVAAEPQLLDAVPTSGPLHMGIAVRQRVLDKVVARAVAAGLDNALDFTDSIALATGQKLGVTTNGTVANLVLNADKACAECVRVDGRLGGDVSVTLPLLGSQKVPLSGSFSIVAPVRVESGKDGMAAVRLDLSKAAEVNRSHVDPEVTQLPPTWWKVIKGPLGGLVHDAITKNLEPVTLFHFKAPDLGVEGLQVLPAQVITDASRGVLFVGFRTNLPVARTAAGGLEPWTDLGKNDHLAVGVDRTLVGSLGSALLHSGKLSRTWTKAGKADPSGPIHVTMGDFEVGDVAKDAGAAPAALKFRAWNLPADGKCWWADVAATGTVSVTDAMAVEVKIDDANIEESSLEGIFETVANWVTSTFVLDTSKVVTKALSRDAIEFPGSTVTVKKGKLTSTPDALWFRAAVEVSD